METTSHNPTPAQPDIRPLLMELAPKDLAKQPGLDKWQKLPLVQIPLPVVPPKQDEFRNWGINE